LGIGDDEAVASMRLTLLTADDLNPVGHLIVYPVPPTLNCSGVVSTMDYCYAVLSIQLNSERLIFTFLILEQDDLSFNVIKRVEVHSTPSEGICTRNDIGLLRVQYCCDKISLNSFSLPTPNFAFGVITTVNNPLVYNAANYPTLTVEQYRTTQDSVTIPDVGGTFTLSESNRVTDRALGLIQFSIGKCQRSHFLIKCILLVVLVLVAQVVDCYCI